MMRQARDFGTMIEKPAVPGMSANVIFASSRFPNYRIGVYNQMLDARNDPKIISMKEVIARETAQLLEQQMRLSVRDLARKFEKGLAAAARLSDEARLREAASLEKHVLVKKLRDTLESLKGRVGGGGNRADIQEVISMVESLAIKLTQREGELIQEKTEVKKLANFIKQASEDAKKLVNEERAFARAEIERAKAAVRRIEEAVQEHERSSRVPSKEELEELMKEVQEARLIKMLHRQSKVMDMERELQALRGQLAEKTKRSIELQKQLEIIQKGERDVLLYELNGAEALGSCLEIQLSSNDAPKLSECSIQWYRVSHDGGKKELISGATKAIYAPEPYDVGRMLQATITSDGRQITLTTTGPIDPAPGLASYVELLLRKHDTQFNVVVTQMNGMEQPTESIHVLHVGKMTMKLSKDDKTIAKEFYSSSMQLCGVRGGGNAAAQALFWQASKGASFILAFESERERNAAIMLARRFAFDCNITLVGPNDALPEATP